MQDERKQLRRHKDESQPCEEREEKAPGEFRSGRIEGGTRERWRDRIGGEEMRVMSQYERRDWEVSLMLKTWTEDGSGRMSARTKTKCFHVCPT